MKKAAAVTTSCLVILGCVGAAAAMHKSPPSATSHHRAIAPQPPAREGASSEQGRIRLSPAQVQQALASGTIDRPIQSLLATPKPMKFGDYQWNDFNVPSGPTFIRVDLQSQIISVFRSGHEIGTAVIVYGGDNKETPTGKVHILGKAREHRSSLYDAAMPYTLRLTDDGVSIHASSVRWGAATHGCIGVPLDFARRLFDTVRVGDDVIITASREGSGDKLR